MILNEIIEQVKAFRQVIYKLFNKRRDAKINLVDALSSNTKAKTVVELSENNLFERKHSSITPAINEFFPEEKNKEEPKKLKEEYEKEISIAISKIIPVQKKRIYLLFALDTTTIPRPYAKTLKDLHIAYKPNPISGNKPITIGHSLSLLTYLPEVRESSWVLPLSSRRVLSNEKGAAVGIKQITELMKETKSSLNDQLCVVSTDSLYGTHVCQKEASSEKNLILIARGRSNRNFYYQPINSKGDKSGHPTWYGEEMKLSNPTTHKVSDYENKFEHKTKKGKILTVNISCWYNMLMRGRKEFDTHNYPFTLVRGVVTDSDGKNVYKNPLWLMAFGEKRNELNPTEIFNVYQQRYDIEHYFRFSKRNLLLASYQTPETEHEEAWHQLSMLAYVQLFMCRELAKKLPKPWEKHLSASKTSSLLTPTQVQRDFERLVNQELGTPAKEVKKRGIPEGRKKGYKPVSRPTMPVIYKSKKKQLKKNKQLLSEVEIKAKKANKPANYSEIVNELNHWLKNIKMEMPDFLNKLTSELSSSS